MRLLDMFRRSRASSPPARGRRGYDAIKAGRLWSDWATQPLTADADLRGNLRTLRARGRDMDQNYEFARRYRQLLIDNVVGPDGVRLQMRAKNADGSFDAAANRIIEQAWADWCRRGQCTVDGRMTFTEAQEMFLGTTARDGEIFVLKVVDRSLPQGFALQLIEADQIPEDLNWWLSSGGRVSLGIELSAAGRPLAYWVDQSHPGEPSPQAGARRTRVSADAMIHGARFERPTQTRGVPWLISALPRLRMLKGYEEAELIAARTGASKVGFFTQEAEATEDVRPPDADEQQADGSWLTNVEPGSFTQLPQGFSFQGFDPQHPTQAFPAFRKAMLQAAASASGISYTVFANDPEGVNYSTLRQFALDDRSHFKVLQRWLIDAFLQPVFDAWLEVQLLRGALGNLPASKIDKFRAASWQPRGWQWVDPEKEVNAAVTAIGNGLASRTDKLAEVGIDFGDHIQTLVAEQAAIASAGLVLNQAPAPASKPEVQNAAA